MDPTIFLILAQDGVVNGAIYALLAISLVLVFTVTRVILIPQGELVAFGGLTYAALDAGQVPGSVYLLGALGAGAFAFGMAANRRTMSGPVVGRLVAETLVLPAVVIALTFAFAASKPGPALEALLALAIVTPMAPYLYRIAFAPLGQASVLVLLIASVGAHFALNGLGLVFFGAEGYRATAFSSATLALGDLSIPGQAIWIVGLTVFLVAALAGFFGFTLLGRALRATAVNRLGARLVGISTTQSGLIAFTLAGLIGALSGVLITPLATIYYDSGFLIGLKGFTAAIVGGLASYPAAGLAAIGIGVLESFASFYASAFKEVIVFTVIVPVLLYRSLRGGSAEEDSE